MKKSNTQILKKSTTTLLLGIISLSVNAQKLPNVQAATGLRAPAGIKIDGKTTEWDNTFQAYNHATEIYYTIANDDDKLYLVVQATDRQIINKIIGGGITLTIQKSGKKTDKDGISIIYPLFDAKDRPYLRGGGGPGKIYTFGNGGGIGGDALITKNSDPSNANVKTEGDSIMNVYNKLLDEKSKNIAVIGIPGLDTLISVYNEDGIKTGQRFNNKMVYTYELSIDLKKLGLSDAAKFAYNIKINGSAMGVVNIVQGNGSNPAMQQKMQQLLAQVSANNNIVPNTQGGSADPAAQQKAQQMMSQALGANNSSVATDFWGEYTLAKK